MWDRSGFHSNSLGTFLSPIFLVIVWKPMLLWLYYGDSVASLAASTENSCCYNDQTK